MHNATFVENKKVFTKVCQKLILLAVQSFALIIVVVTAINKLWPKQHGCRQFHLFLAAMCASLSAVKHNTHQMHSRELTKYCHNWWKYWLVALWHEGCFKAMVFKSPAKGQKIRPIQAVVSTLVSQMRCGWEVVDIIELTLNWCLYSLVQIPGQWSLKMGFAGQLIGLVCRWSWWETQIYIWSMVWCLFSNRH